MITTRIVSSSTLTQAAYDEASRMLCLEFSSGAIYCYLDVPIATYRQLVDAPSKGAWFNKHIRGCFRFLRLPGAGIPV